MNNTVTSKVFHGRKQSEVDLSAITETPIPLAPGLPRVEAPASWQPIRLDETRLTTVPQQLPVETPNTIELVRLYNRIAEATRGTGTLVQFVGTDTESGSAELAYNTAWIGASLLGRRVLFLDAWDEPNPSFTPPVISPAKRLHHVALGQARIEDAIVRQAETDLFVGILQKDRSSSELALGTQQVKKLLESLRDSFDMIIVAPPPALLNPFAAMLAPSMDGSVIVLEANHSRAKLAKEAASLLNCGSRILGAVLTNQCNHLPQWLRRWL